MARVNNLSNFLTDVASAIKTKKGSETAIPAADFDTEILALPSQGVYQTKVITINENGQTVITPDSGYDAMDGVQVTTNVPEKQLQTKSYNFTTNQTIELTPDTGYDGFDQVNLEINVPSGGGDIKLFETEQAMQADPNPSEGDLAVVYGEETNNWDGVLPPASVIFPEIVTLSTAVSTEIRTDAYMMNDDFSIYTRFSAHITATEAYFYFEGNDWFNCEYTSSDGITYTKSTSGSTTYVLPVGLTNIDWFEPFDSTIGYFMQAYQTIFTGFYKYEHTSLGAYRPPVSITKQEAVSISSNDSFTNINTDIYVMRPYTELQTVYAGVLIQSSNLLQTVKNPQGQSVNIRLITSAIFYDPGRMICVYNDDVYMGDTASYNATDLIANFNKGYYVLENDTITFHKATSASDLQLSVRPGGSGNWYNGQTLPNQNLLLGSIDNYQYSSKFLEEYIVVNGVSGVTKLTDSATTTYTIINPSIELENWHYVYAPTQLNLRNTYQLLPNVTGYGNNGVVEGDGSIMSHLPVENVWSDIFNISTSINNVPDSNADKYYTTTHLSSYDEGTNKLYGYILDENGQYTITRYEYGATTNRLGSPKVQLGTKLYYVIQNTAEAIIILEFDATTKETTTYTVANSATGSVNVSITENYIVYGYTTGSYKAYTYHVRKQHKTTGEQTEAASWAIYNNNNIYLVGGINDKVLIGTDRNQNSNATYMRTVNLITNAVTIVGNTGIPMGLPGMHFTDNRYAYIPTIYKVTGSSLIKDSGYGWFYDFENNVGLWVYPTVKHTSGWYNSGVCPATTDYAILGMASDHPDIFIKYTTATHTLSEVTITPSTSSSYDYPMCVKNDTLYFTNCAINVRTNTSTTYNFNFSAGYGYDISIESTRVRVFHPYKTNKSITYIFPVSATSIDLYDLPDIILTKGQNRSSGIKR